MSNKKRTAILISGRGSNMMSLVTAAEDPAYPAEIALVISNRAGAAAVLTRAAQAHHSDSLYFVDDRSTDGGAVRLEGTIARVRWINPHSEFFVDVAQANGASEQWAIETDSINQLRAMGWTDKTLEVGDKVVVVVSKSKFDDTAGRLRDMLVYNATADEPVTLRVSVAHMREAAVLTLALCSLLLGLFPWELYLPILAGTPSDTPMLATLAKALWPILAGGVLAIDQQQFSDDVTVNVPLQEVSATATVPRPTAAEAMPR